MVAGSLADEVDRESQLLTSLRRGDESAFELLVARHAPGMLRVARTYVASDEAAQDVVQDTWVAVMRGLERFEGRCSVKTWLYRILINRAKSSGVRERRVVPVSAVTDDGPTVAPERFRADSATRRPRHWLDPPRPWQRDPQAQMIGAELVERLHAAIGTLPDLQRRVVVLRDVEGVSAAETAELLGLTAGNQRMLLHRGRAKLRQSLEDYLSEEAAR